VGASVMLPEASELVVSVRVDEPAVAVIVTEVAFTACQVRVRLCPASMAAALAEKTSEGGSELLTPLQPDSHNNATAIEAQVTQQRILFLMVDFVALPSPRACDIQMRRLTSKLVGFS